MALPRFADNGDLMRVDMTLYFNGRQSRKLLVERYHHDPIVPCQKSKRSSSLPDRVQACAHMNQPEHYSALTPHARVQGVWVGKTGGSAICPPTEGLHLGPSQIRTQSVSITSSQGSGGDLCSLQKYGEGDPQVGPAPKAPAQLTCRCQYHCDR